MFASSVCRLATVSLFASANSALMTDKVTIDLVGEPQVWSRTASTPVAAC